MFGAFFQPTHMACSECGESVELALVDVHACDAGRRADFRIFQLRHEIAAFELDFNAWLGSAEGRFAAFLAWRSR